MIFKKKKKKFCHQNFVINQINFNFIALQYTTLGSDVTFSCHHGPNECYGNKVHSCAIEHIQVRI